MATTEERKNGAHHQSGGRKVPAFPELTLPDSGVTLQIIGAMGPLIQQALGNQLRRERPEPRPPENLVDYGDGKKAKEPNYSDPDYEKALTSYNVWLQNEAGNRALNYIIANCIDADVDEAAVARTRKGMAAMGIDLAEVDDREVYLRYVVFTSPKDLDALVEVVERKSKPTEAVIQEEVASF